MIVSVDEKARQKKFKEQENSSANGKRAIEVLRESMTNLANRYNQTTGIGSVASIGNRTDFTKKPQKGNTRHFTEAEVKVGLAQYGGSIGKIEDNPIINWWNNVAKQTQAIIESGRNNTNTDGTIKYKIDPTSRKSCSCIK